MKKRLEQIIMSKGGDAFRIVAKDAAEAAAYGGLKKLPKGVNKNIVSQMSNRLPGRNPHYSLRFPPSKYNSKGPAIYESNNKRRLPPRR